MSSISPTGGSLRAIAPLGFALLAIKLTGLAVFTVASFVVGLGGLGWVAARHRELS